ncbi:glutathione S-transferase C-terminal domain-containing protein [Microlunatus antarcticus]|uniref:Glutathionyl-hydroquinone reductase n=1 Tax=Microlunatus antarcticus TaxID=53388 RepID=A0A7W5JX52_9ACTN|nr:glutathione S-transferase C-terminal domain-containing protein [Microlunatus antarcticus]MBB3327942.1 glutathionyl-hydroquinone reductase [Microlunatus antarcticus]
MTSTTTRASYASPVDTDRYGTYAVPQRPGDPRPLYRFTGRLTRDGSSGFPAVAGRYHLYAGWFCPWAQRVVLELEVNGLQDVVGVSYVDGARDGRGWAFREANGPDPVHGFTLLRDAYEATEPGFDGHVSVPTLWDTQTGRIVSNDYRTLGLDVATEFAELRSPGVDTYPEAYRAEIDELDAWVGPAVNSGVGRAAGEGPAAEQARTELHAAFRRLDDRLVDGGFLVGHGLTEADIRLWVTLARYDVQGNQGQAGAGRLGPPLSHYPHLARYAAYLAGLPAFAASTRWSAFSAPGATPSFLEGDVR